MEAVEELTQASFAGVPDDKLIEMGIDSLKMMQLGAYIEERRGSPCTRKTSSS